MEFRHIVRALLSALFVTPLLVFINTSGASKNQVPVFHEDLRPYGFLSKPDATSVNYTDLNFLSNDLLLVSINVRQFGPVEPLFSDTPPSKLLLFDVSQRKLVRSTDLPIEKDSGSIRATRNGQFALLDRSGVRVCSIELLCGKAFATEGPLMVSPGGSRIVVGGNAQSEEKVLDSETLTETARFPWMISLLVPGDNGTLLLKSGAVLLKSSGKPDQSITSVDWPAQFLNDGAIAGFDADNVVVVKLDGSILYRIPILKSYQTHIVPSNSGFRFCIDEVGYARWSLPSLLGYGDVPYHIERVRVIDTASGHQLFDMKWDPRPYVGHMVVPALSPDGHRIAVIRHGTLDVFQIP